MQLLCIFMPFALRLAPFCTTFSTILHYVLHHFALRFAPKRTLFCTKTHAVLHQNALRFAPYCAIFCYKQPRSWCKWRPFQINIHFSAFTCYPLFASKQTLARIDFLRPSERLVRKKAPIMLNFLLKI